MAQMRAGEILRFGIAGAANVGVTFAAYALLVAGGVTYLVANLLAWALGILCAYFLNLIFVFRQREQTTQQYTRQFGLFAGLYILSFFLSSLALAGLVESGLLDPIRAQLVVIPLIATFNFLASKFLVFRPDQSDHG